MIIATKMNMVTETDITAIIKNIKNDTSEKLVPFFCYEVLCYEVYFY